MAVKFLKYYTDYADNLAAGNFKYIADNADDTKGHNVAEIDSEGTLTGPPGDEHSTGITASNFTCAGKYGCHGDCTTTDDYPAMKGAHLTDDSSIDGNDTGTSFRFLKGVLGLENNDATYPWQDRTASLHNEYKGAINTGTESTATEPGGTISGLCAECHGNFHYSTDVGSASPWLRHPTDITLPSSGEYTSYNTDNSYSTIAPVARVTIPGTPSNTVTPSGSDDDIVMCLSCHGAHATNYFKMMSWDYKGWPPGTNGCNICHTSKD